MLDRGLRYKLIIQLTKLCIAKTFHCLLFINFRESDETSSSEDTSEEETTPAAGKKHFSYESGTESSSRIQLESVPIKLLPHKHSEIFWT